MRNLVGLLEELQRMDLSEAFHDPMPLTQKGKITMAEEAIQRQGFSTLRTLTKRTTSHSPKRRTVSPSSRRTSPEKTMMKKKKEIVEKKELEMKELEHVKH